MRRAVAILSVLIALTATTACGGGGGGGSSSASASSGTTGGTTTGGTTTGGTTGGGGSRVVVRYTAAVTARHDHAVGDTETYAIDGTYPTVHSLTSPLLPSTVRFVFDDTQNAVLGNGPNDQIAWEFTDATHLFGAATDPVFDSHGTRINSDSYTIEADVLPFQDPGHVGFYRARVSAVPTGGGSGVRVGDDGYLVVGPSGYATLARLDLGGVDGPLWLAKQGSSWVGQASAYHAADKRVESEALSVANDFATGSYRVFHGSTTDVEVTFALTRITLPDARGHRGLLGVGTAPDYVDSTAYGAARYPTPGAAVTATIHPSTMTVTVASGATSETFAIDSAWYDAGAGTYTVTGMRDDVDASLSTARKQVIEDCALEFTPAGVLRSGSIAWSLAFDPTPDQEDDPSTDTPNDTLLGFVEIAP